MSHQCQWGMLMISGSNLRNKIASLSQGLPAACWTGFPRRRMLTLVRVIFRFQRLPDGVMIPLLSRLRRGSRLPLTTDMAFRRCLVVFEGMGLTVRLPATRSVLSRCLVNAARWTFSRADHRRAREATPLVEG